MKDSQRGYLITIEGIDGSGKSSLAKLLVRRLISNNNPAICTAEPTSSAIGRMLREILQSNQRKDNAWLAVEAAYFFADRIEHNAKVIQPALTSGNHVVCDRYDLGTLVYQAADKSQIEDLMGLTKILHERRLVLRPDFTILVDLPAEKALNRIERKDSIPEKYESLPRLRQARERFLSTVDFDGRRHVVLDGSKNIQTVSEGAFNATMEVLGGAKIDA